MLHIMLHSSMLHFRQTGRGVTCGLAVDMLKTTNQMPCMLASTMLDALLAESERFWLQVVESQPRNADPEDGRAVRVSHLTLVDLAGSERLGKTGLQPAPIRPAICSLAACWRNLTHCNRVVLGLPPHLWLQFLQNCISLASTLYMVFRARVCSSVKGKGL